MGARARTTLWLGLALAGAGAPVAAGQSYAWLDSLPDDPPALLNPQPSVTASAGGGLDARVAALKQRLAADELRAAEIDTERRGLEGQRERARARARQRARALYRVSRGGLLPLAGGVDALLGHANRVGRLRRLVLEDLNTLERLRARERALRQERATLRERLATSRVELAQLSEAQRGLVQERRTARQFEEAFTGGAGSAPAAARGPMPYGLSVVGGVAQQRFAAQRGQLALPISGPSEIREAHRAESDGSGLELAGRRGSAVRAVAAGRVAFADTYGSYGRLVILDHGDRYYTVYAGLRHSDVRVGDELSRSAKLGSLGEQPLYFEVRRGTRNQDARSWLGL